MEDGSTDAAVRKNLLDRLLNTVKQVMIKKGEGCLLTQQISYYKCGTKKLTFNHGFKHILIMTGAGSFWC